MSEEQELTEADVGRAGVEKSQGYSPMPMATPDPPRDDYHDLGGEEFDARSAAEELANRRVNGVQPDAPALTDEPLHRDYIHLGGEKSGEARPSNEVVPIDRASRDISSAREAEDAAKIAQVEADLIRQLDSEARAGQQQAQSQPEQQPEATPVEPQPEQQQPDNAAQADELARLFQQNPALLQTVEQYRLHSEQQVAQAQEQAAQAAQAAQQQYAQQYAAAVQNNAQAAMAGLTAQFSELAGLTTQEQLQTAIQTLQRTSPDRARAITDYIGRVRSLMVEAEHVRQSQQSQAQQQYQQQYQQQQAAAQEWFQKSAQADDTAFENYAKAQGLSDQHLAEIKNEARTMLRDDYGLDDKTLGQLWNSDPMFRSFQSQRLILDATRYRMAQRGARDKLANPVPIVQRSGSPAARGSEVDYNLGKLSAELSKTGSAKAAAALLTARRATSRR